MRASMNIFTHTITLYNHSVQNGKDTWTRKVIRGVFWRPNDTRQIDTEGKLNIVETVKITIPYRGEEYMFGLDDLDIIAYGERTEELTDENFEAFVKQPDVMTIIGVRNFTNVNNLPLWEVECKCL